MNTNPVAYVKSKLISTKETSSVNKIDTSCVKEENSKSKVFKTNVNNDFSNKTKRKCYKCGKLGHIQKQCTSQWPSNSYSSPNYNPHRGRGSYGRSRGFNRGYSRGYSRGNGANFRGRGKGAPYNGNRNVESFMLQTMQSSVSQNSSIPENSGQKSIKWYLDSGATDHVVDKKEYFSKYVQLTEPTPVKLGDGRFVYSNCIGTVPVYFDLGYKNVYCKISNVYLVEEMACNLLSVSTIDRAGYTYFL